MAPLPANRRQSPLITANRRKITAKSPQITANYRKLPQMEIESGDVIRVILQFLKENKLVSSLKSLQKESNVCLNTVDSVEAFTADILHGRWDNVLQQTAMLQLPIAKLFNLYEHITLEMIELHEIEVAKELLRNTEIMNQMKSQDPERYLRLEKILGRADFDPLDAYRGKYMEKCRQDLSEELALEVTVVPSGRLMTLLNQALKWQKYQGLLPRQTQFDLFSAAPRTNRYDTQDVLPKKQCGKIKFGKKTFATCAGFSLDGDMLLTGSMDGLIEVWDYETCKLRKDLPYQETDDFMMHEEQVLSLNFSVNGELLATGSSDGIIKVWDLSSGRCTYRLEAHGKGVTCIAFSKDCTQILSGSLDHKVRLHGLKSKNMLKEFRGHTAYINSICFSSDQDFVLSASSDGSVKIWNYRTAQCVQTFLPPESVSGVELDVNSIQLYSKDQYLVCSRSCSIHLITLQAQILRTFKKDKTSDGDFVGCVVSPQGKFLYAVTDKGMLYCYTLETGTLEKTVEVSDKEVFGVIHNPLRNLLGTFGKDGSLKLWKP